MSEAGRVGPWIDPRNARHVSGARRSRAPGLALEIPLRYATPRSAEPARSLADDSRIRTIWNPRLIESTTTATPRGPSVVGLSSGRAPARPSNSKFAGHGMPLIATASCRP